MHIQKILTLLWVFDNEIASDLTGTVPGDVVSVHSQRGDYIATGYVNPLSRITVRVLTRDPKQSIDRRFLLDRIREADHLRLSLRPENRYYRMVYAEADRLPGLVIDRYDSHFVVQITTAGMEHFKGDIFSIIGELYPDPVVVEKSITQSRAKEGLPDINRVVTVAGGEGSARTVIEVNGIKFEIDFLNSQKTGFFLDQRDNYRLLSKIAKDRDVLDVFSYAGAWGLHAYQNGARHVSFLEISQDNLDLARRNTVLNGYDPADFEFRGGDAVKELKEMSKSGEKRGIVILDPPAFVKTRRKLKDAVRGYKEINLRALKMIESGGFLVTCSCSHFLQPVRFVQVVFEAALDARRQVRLVAFRGQPYDHSILLPLYQSEYLKCALLYVY